MVGCRREHSAHVALTACLPDAPAPRLVGPATCLVVDAWSGRNNRQDQKPVWTKDELFWSASFRYNGAGREILRRPRLRRQGRVWLPCVGDSHQLRWKRFR